MRPTNLTGGSTLRKSSTLVLPARAVIPRPLPHGAISGQILKLVPILPVSALGLVEIYRLARDGTMRNTCTDIATWARFAVTQITTAGAKTDWSGCFAAPMRRITRFSYTGSGALRTVKDANLHVTTFSYDEADRKTQISYNISYNKIDHQDFTYDDVGNLLTRRTTSGKYQKFHYDVRDRKDRMWWGLTDDVNYVTDISWANGIDRSEFDYDAAGRLTFASNSFSTVTRSYDDAGRLKFDRQNLGAIDKTVRYRYDFDSRPKRIFVVVNGYDRQYLYDGMGRLEWISNSSDSKDWFGYKYDLSSNEIERKNYHNGLVQVYTRDNINRMSRRDIKLGAATVAYDAYGFDGMNRVETIDREDGKRDFFDYDNNGQMILAKYGMVANVNPLRTVSYDLDWVGNRKSVTENGASKAYGTDALNRYYSVGADTLYDTTGIHAVGKYQTPSAATTYAYVGDTFLAKVTGSSTYTLGYDALGRCVKRTLGGVVTYYLYDGDKPIIEYKADGTQAAWNVYGKGVDEILMRSDYVADPGGQGYFYQQDRTAT